MPREKDGLGAGDGSSNQQVVTGHSAAGKTLGSGLILFKYFLQIVGDTFSPRVAGNISNEDILCSMEYACAVVSSKLVLVMRHTACGAIKDVIDNVRFGNLTGLLGKMRPAIDATQYDGERTAKSSPSLNAVAWKNVELTMAGIHAGSPVLKRLEDQGHIKIPGEMYCCEAGVVELIASTHASDAHVETKNGLTSRCSLGLVLRRVHQMLSPD